MEKLNRDKATALYSEIDRNSLFEATVQKEDRSDMNVCFRITKQELEDSFNQFAKENDCIGIKGHRSVGGFRASLYNAMSIQGVQKLISVMKDFEKNHA